MFFLLILSSLAFIFSSFIVGHLLLLLTVHVDSLRFSCSYAKTSEASPTIDECVTHNLTALDEHERVTSISGDLTQGILVYHNIVALKVKSSPNMNFLPRGIDMFFKNLQHLDILECGLKRLTKRDVEVFPLLKRLSLRGNKLEHFDFNILSSNHEIEYVDLSFNGLKRIDTRFVARMAHLNFIDVEGNACVAAGSARGRGEVMRLIHRIYESCSDGFGEIKFVSFTLVGCLIALMLLLIMYHCLKGLLRQ